MNKIKELEQYTQYLCEVIGHADRHESLRDYCRGLMLPIARKSVEPLAAHIAPYGVSAKHQSLHHFVSKSDWSDETLLARVRDWVLPAMKFEGGVFWIVDDTGYPKKGKHSVGVARQYCGQLGKQDNCQVAVSLSVACETASLPVSYRLYLPKEWADDEQRRRKAGVPDRVEFATKPEIAVEQMRQLQASGVKPGVVLADAGYGGDTGFREAISAFGLVYSVGVKSSVTVWPRGRAPLPLEPHCGVGRPATKLRRGPGHKPVSVRELAQGLNARQWQTVCWRQGVNGDMVSRFAAARVRAAHRDEKRSTLRAEEWLLIEWPDGEPEPTKYWLSTLPSAIQLDELVKTTKMRWRIERDYQDLKQEFGLDHYEGRSWRGFHHHATLSIAAYGFLVAQRLNSGAVKKNAARPKPSALPEDYIPRGSSAGTAPRPRFNRHAAPLARRRNCADFTPLPLLRLKHRRFMTQ